MTSPKKGDRMSRISKRKPGARGRSRLTLADIDAGSRAGTAGAASRLTRGIWEVPFFGPEGETILVAIDRAGRRIEERSVPPGANRVIVQDELLARLDVEDPVRRLEIVRC
jgi:hypothetical protein